MRSMMTREQTPYQLPEPYPGPPARERCRRWPGWAVVLAVCAAPVVIPLALCGALLLAGLFLGILAVTAGLGLGGAALVGCGVLSSLVGAARIFTEGLAGGLYYMGVGAMASTLGFCLLALCAGLVLLDWKAGKWLLGRRGEG